MGRVLTVVRNVIVMATLLMVGIGAALATSETAQATVPGTPGVPQASSLVYAEDFQNRAGPTPIARLTGYTGTSGMTYTAAPEWLAACNGWIASAAQPVASSAQVADCGNSQASWNQAQRLAQAIGMYRGQTATQARNNFATTAYTAAPAPGAGKVEFRTSSNIPFAGTNRFLAFSVDVAAANCATASAPLLQFSLVNSAGVATNVGSQINGCSSTTSITPPALGNAPASELRVGTYTSNGALLFSGSSGGIRMINNNGSAAGNDHAFDNIRLLDVTPQLDKSFSPTTRFTGQTSTLTLTVTNTSELGAKNGWSFTDTLPTGLTVAGTTTTTCPAATTNAPVGGGSVAVSANLSANMVSCTITVPVTSTAAGTYTNGPSNITTSGLNPPANASVAFVAPAPGISLVKSAVPAGFTDFVVGQTVNYSFVVTNTGNVPLTSVRVDEEAFTGTGVMSAVACPPAAASMAVGAQTTCTASYVVTQADVDAGSLTNSATATGTPALGSTPTSDPSEVTIPSSDPVPVVTLAKSASPTTVTAAGQTVNFSFLVRNAGNVTLENVSIYDDEFSGDGQLSAIQCPAGAASVAPGGTVTCTASYVVTQSDMDAGLITNTASAVGTPPDGPDAVSEPSSAAVTVTSSPALTLSKSASPRLITAAGQTVGYSFVVTNTGNVTLAGVTITETVFSGTDGVPAVSCPPSASDLAPAAIVICTASYTATQADIDAGRITNTAVALGTSPGDAEVTSEPSSADVIVFLALLPLTGGTSAEQVLVLGGAAVLFAVVLAILHQQHARRGNRPARPGWRTRLASPPDHDHH